MVHEGLDSVLFKNIDIVTEEKVLNGDVFIRNGTIEEISHKISRHAELEINDSGLTLIPGVIDPHVHFRDPGAAHKETIETGSRAAASGGVTSFFDMPNTHPLTVTAEAMQDKKNIAKQTSLINYNFFIGANNDNLDVLNTVENVPGIKIFVGSSTGNMLVDSDEKLRAIFSTGNRLIAVHSEDETEVQSNYETWKSSTDVSHHLNIRTVSAALRCTKRLVQLSKKYQRRLHICHLTTEEEAVFLENEKAYPLITTEVTPQHLFLEAPQLYEKLGTFAQINPPIREKRHRMALWKALKKGVISCIGTDHAPHTIEEKMKGFPHAPSGMPGVETSLPLLLTQVNKGNCSLNEVVRWMCASPASLYQIPNKGMIKVGFDADLTVIDMKKKYTIRNQNMQTKCQWSAFDGEEVSGSVVATFVNGNMVYREGDFFDKIKGKEIRIGYR